MSSKRNAVALLPDLMDVASEQGPESFYIWIAQLYANGMARQLGFNSTEHLLDTLGVTRRAQQEALRLYFAGLLKIPSVGKRLGDDVVAKLRTMIDTKLHDLSPGDYLGCKRALREAAKKIPFLPLMTDDGNKAMKAFKAWVESECQE